MHAHLYFVKFWFLKVTARVRFLKLLLLFLVFNWSSVLCQQNPQLCHILFCVAVVWHMKLAAALKGPCKLTILKVHGGVLLHDTGKISWLYLIQGLAFTAIIKMGTKQESVLPATGLLTRQNDGMRWDQNIPWRGYRVRSSNNYPNTWAVVVWSFWLQVTVFSACCHCRYLCCVWLLNIIVTKVRASGKSVMMMEKVLDPLEHFCFSVKLHMTRGPA